MHSLITPMMWERMGPVYCPDNEADWCVSHASSPRPLHVGGGVYRIFFSCRDGADRSAITSIDYDIVSGEIVSRTLKPLVMPGEPGLFDDCGCFLGDVVRVGDSLYMYYQGWSLAKTAPQNNFIGLAVSCDNGGSFVKHSSAPVVDRTGQDPFSLNAPAVLFEQGRFQMWYGSIRSWGEACKTPQIVVRTAYSDDGACWNTSDAACIKPESDDECAFVVSTVLRESGRYKMFYSYRGERFRIGYAESDDGIAWVRMDDQIRFEGAVRDWESEMTEYPAVFMHTGQIYMLYCGNGYGKTGFGLARLIT